MKISLFIVVTLYIIAMIYCAIKARKLSIGKPHEYLLAGSSVKYFFGFLTFSATLFSTFTLMGMPDFFRSHGVGSWVFLGVTDVAMATLVLLFGLEFRKQIKKHGFTSVSSFLSKRYGTNNAGLIYVIGVFVFLLPYVAIQIRGIAIFLSSATPGVVPIWLWSVMIVLAMLVYSIVGGMRAIIYSDAVQGVVLLVVTWIIAVVCLDISGGIKSLFQAVERTNILLLTAPGPKGVLNFQFLLASFIAIVIMPITQPQLTMRIAILKSNKELRKMSVAFGLFSLFVIMPTIFIGLYGAINYQEVDTSTFLYNVLVVIQNPIIGSLAIIGLIAAAMSTADSQLFALGNELQTLFSGTQLNPLIRAKLAVLLFAMSATALAIISSDQLVLLARISFAGTGMLAPIILIATYSKSPNKMIIFVTGITLTIFTMATLKLIPSNLFGVRIDLILFLVMALFCGKYIYSKSGNEAR